MGTSRRIIRNRAIVEDRWQHVPDGAELPAGNVVVTLARWRAERERLLGEERGVGVLLAGADDPHELAPDVERLELVALEFGKFTDGRGYSQARLLREGLRFRGELRAVGEMLPDQLSFMERCGIDAFELPERLKLEDALAAFSEFSVAYQPAGDADAPIFQRRPWRARARG